MDVSDFRCRVDRGDGFLRVRFGLMAIAFWVWFSVVSWHAVGDDVRAEESKSLEQILTAWNDRQNRIQTFYFEIIASSSRMSDESLTYREYRLYADGFRYRLEQREAASNLIVEGLRLEHHAEIFDGDREISVDVCGHDIYVKPWFTSAHNPNYQSEGHETEVWPVFHSFRILQPGFLPAGSDCWSLSGRTGVVEGRECIILNCREPQYGSDSVYEVWVDPTRDFVAVRREYKQNGMVLGRLDIEHELDDEAGWVPTSWVSAGFRENPDGIPELYGTSIYEVADRKINQHIDDDLFTLENRVVWYPPFTQSSSGPPAPANAWRWIAALVMLSSVVVWLWTSRRRKLPA